MALAENQHNVEARSPTRPGSAWTSDSLFADSAISLRTNTPKPSENGAILSEMYEQVDPIANRLNGLVSEIWASEQDGSLRASKRRRIETAIDHIEAILLEDDAILAKDSDEITQSQASPSTPPVVVQEELDAVHNNLAITIGSMRMRQREQRHLHQLTVEKLEAVAQRCIQQEKRLREFSDEIVMLKERNHLLTRENDLLNTQLDHSREESRKRDIAVNAMSSAVAGLEGWINRSPTPSRTPRRVVIRGRGRFRGRYYVDEPEEGPIGQDGDTASEAKTLHEGVNAWLRGFNDIEQELRSTSVAVTSVPRDFHDTPQQDEDDDWGDFQSVPGA